MAVSKNLIASVDFLLAIDHKGGVSQNARKEVMAMDQEGGVSQDAR